MSDLITELRGMAEAGTADFSIIGTGGTASYWSDDHLQPQTPMIRTVIATVKKSQRVGSIPIDR